MTNCTTANSTCWFDVDPQSLPVQIVGYCAAAIVIGHAVPTLIKIWRSKNPSHVPLMSLIARMVLGLNIAVFGLLICQTSQIVSGLGSFLVFLPIAVLKGVYAGRKRLEEQEQDRQEQDKQSLDVV